MIALIIVGMFLDGVSTFLILLPVLQPIANSYGWDMVWFGVILTMKIAIGQFTPPLAVNLMVSCKIAQVPMEVDHPVGILDDSRDVRLAGAGGGDSRVSRCGCRARSAIRPDYSSWIFAGSAANWRMRLRPKFDRGSTH